jgi:hypothetical protein
MTEQTQTEFTPPQPVDQVVAREAAPAALEQLRADRLNGKLGQDAYLQRSEYLHGVLAAEPGAAAPAPPKAFATQDEQLEQSYANHMQAPKPEHYANLPQAKAFEGDEALAFDTAVRNCFHRGGIPAHLAPSILEGVIKNFDTLAGADESARAAALSASQAKLREYWGQDFDARLNQVDELVADMVEASPELGDMYDRAPWLFAADPAVMEYLDRVAQHRAGAKA